MERLKAILGRKVAGIPLWVLFGLGILGLAYYLKKRQGSKPQDTGQTATDAGTFPNAYPMNYSNDTYINQTVPPFGSGAGGPTGGRGGHAYGGGTMNGGNPPRTTTVLSGWILDQWLHDINAANPGLNLTKDKFMALNPNYQIKQGNDYGYIDAASGNPASRQPGVIRDILPTTGTVRIQ